MDAWKSCETFLSVDREPERLVDEWWRKHESTQRMESKAFIQRRAGREGHVHFDRAVGRSGAHLRKTATESHDGNIDSESARTVPGGPRPTEGAEHARNHRDSRRPGITVVLRDIRRCEKILANSGLRTVIRVDIHDDLRFYLGLSWAVDPGSGQWRVMHDNTWDVQLLDPESGDYVWTRKSEVRPLKECSAFQQANAHAHLDALLTKATGAMSTSCKDKG